MLRGRRKNINVLLRPVSLPIGISVYSHLGITKKGPIGAPY